MILNRPWLWLPSKAAHDLAPFILPNIARVAKIKDKEWRPLQWRGLKFDNPMGVAGGVDKSGQCLKAWSDLGAGFLEVGTVTPEPQGPNPGKIMDRHTVSGALWNKMGFPNPGMRALKSRLAKQSLRVPLFINIGKNRWTENDKAHLDYAQCISQLHGFADAFVVNLSSPNTKGLRDLLNADSLSQFLGEVKSAIQENCPDKPTLLKLSPDMAETELLECLRLSAPLVDGWILTNTTKQRYTGSPFPADAGGVSGEPLKDLSLQALKSAVTLKTEFPEKLLISVGGVSTAADVRQRLQMGADLVQAYSGLVFAGPLFFKKTLADLKGQDS